MAFINECEGLIRKSNKDMINFKYNKGLVADYIGSDGSLINSKKIVNGDISFVDTCFDIGSDDNVYGVVNNKENHLLYIYNKDNSFDTSTILNYDSQKFNISYPYIKNVNGNVHLIYYLSNKTTNTVSALFHHFNRNGEWFENKIDFVNHLVLNNFVVTWNGDTPTVFYFNSIDGAEELFACRFNHATKVWSNPIQITNSKTPKIYLSIIKDSMNFDNELFSNNPNKIMIDESLINLCKSKKYPKFDLKVNEWVEAYVDIQVCIKGIAYVDECYDEICFEAVGYIEDKVCIPLMNTICVPNFIKNTEKPYLKHTNNIKTLVDPSFIFLSSLPDCNSSIERLLGKLVITYCVSSTMESIVPTYVDTSKHKSKRPNKKQSKFNTVIIKNNNKRA